jgi:hypothetical protein
LNTFELVGAFLFWLTTKFKKRTHCKCMVITGFWTHFLLELNTFIIVKCLQLINQFNNLILQEIMHGMNIVFKIQIKWPKGQNLKCVMIQFKNFYVLPSIHVAWCYEHHSNTYSQIEKAFCARPVQFLKAIFFSSPKLTTCNCKELLIIKRSFEMFLLVCMV